MSIPKNLKGRFIEAINRTELDAVMLRDGYIPFLPVIDGGIDVIYFREADAKILYVQTKGRVCIYKKYLRRKIWMAFSEDDQWYLYRHDDLVKFCESEGLWVHTPSWRNKGGYSVKKIPRPMRIWMARRKRG